MILPGWKGRIGMAFHLKAALALGAMLAAAPAAFAEPADETPPLTVGADTNETLQYSASVEVVTNLEHQGDLPATLFGTGGGDAAMNGLYTYVSFYLSPAEGWRVFRIGDFNSYRLISETPGRVVIEVEENVNGTEITSQTRRLAVTWSAPADGTPPAAVTITTLTTAPATAR
jgi:hypothetical protein